MLRGEKAGGIGELITSTSFSSSIMYFRVNKWENKIKSWTHLTLNLTHGFAMHGQAELPKVHMALIETITLCLGQKSTYI